jgi:hypothetical protein
LFLLPGEKVRLRGKSSYSQIAKMTPTSNISLTQTLSLMERAF